MSQTINRWSCRNWFHPETQDGALSVACDIMMRSGDRTISGNGTTVTLLFEMKVKFAKMLEFQMNL